MNCSQIFHSKSLIKRQTKNRFPIPSFKANLSQNKTQIPKLILQKINVGKKVANHCRTFQIHLGNHWLKLRLHFHHRLNFRSTSFASIKRRKILANTFAIFKSTLCRDWSKVMLIKSAANNGSFKAHISFHFYSPTTPSDKKDCEIL